MYQRAIRISGSENKITIKIERLKSHFLEIRLLNVANKLKFVKIIIMIKVFIFIIDPFTQLFYKFK
ncbi:hypothetical protein MM0347_01320 [Helicobacter pylori]